LILSVVERLLTVEDIQIVVDLCGVAVGCEFDDSLACCNGGLQRLSPGLLVVEACDGILDFLEGEKDRLVEREERLLGPCSGGGNLLADRPAVKESPPHGGAD